MEKLLVPLVDENRYKNLAKRLFKSMAENGSHVNTRRSIWATNLSMRGKDVKFLARILNEFLETPNCDPNEFNSLKDKPPYRDIRNTLYGVDSTASVLLPAKHLTEVIRDRVVLVYMLMKGMPINVRAILRQNMMKFRNNLRWRFCYGGLITHFLRAGGIEEETVDMTVAYHPVLTGKLVDVTSTKALDSSHGPIMSAPER
ncbi:hypothetical protein H5410_031895 [Solanum commersonii]|uniref:Putative plant transposon protein domain-containing protein n=1 Tax=Solanum commersonii TaxID=4109 RepID=A0A9J5YKJ5_SOLCO|nr:hypothetical protein H5410_031895 [Solanum commersonii]